MREIITEQWAAQLRDMLKDDMEEVVTDVVDTCVPEDAADFARRWLAAASGVVTVEAVLPLDPGQGTEKRPGSPDEGEVTKRVKPGVLEDGPSGEQVRDSEGTPTVGA